MKYCVQITVLILFLSCSNTEVQTINVNYKTILSSTSLQNQLQTHQVRTIFNVLGNSSCSDKYTIQYESVLDNDTLWQTITTISKLNSEIIDGIKFTTNEFSLDRIYPNNTANNQPRIYMDFLEKRSWAEGTYDEYLMYQLDCYGKFNFIKRATPFEQKLNNKPLLNKYSGTYSSTSDNISSRLELRDGSNKIEYSFYLEVVDKDKCRRTFTLEKMKFHKDNFEVIKDTIEINIGNEFVQLNISKYEICSQISDEMIVLKRAN